MGHRPKVNVLSHRYGSYQIESISGETPELRRCSSVAKGGFFAAHVLPANFLVLLLLVRRVGILNLGAPYIFLNTRSIVGVVGLLGSLFRVGSVSGARRGPRLPAFRRSQIHTKAVFWP